MNTLQKNTIIKYNIAINPELQRVKWGMEWGMGNQASLPKNLRYRKYFNISDAPPEAKIANINHREKEINAKGTHATTIGRKGLAVIKQPLQNTFNMSKMVSLGIPRSRTSQNSSFTSII